MPTQLENAPPELAEARACLERGDVGEALLLLRLAEGSPGPATEVRRLLGLAHLASGDLGAAIEDLAAAARALPQDPEILAALDAAMERLADRAAGPAAESIAVRSPDDPTAPAREPAIAATSEPVMAAPAEPAIAATLEPVMAAPSESAIAAMAAPAGADAFAAVAAADEEDLIRELARAGSYVTPEAGGILDRMATAVGRRALPWAVAFFLVGAGGFTAIATFRLRAGSSVAGRDAVAAPGAGGESGAEQRVPGARSTRADGRIAPVERGTPAAAGDTATAPSGDGPEPDPGSDGPAAGATGDPAGPAGAAGDPADAAGAAGDPADAATGTPDRPAVRAPDATSGPRASPTSADEAPRSGVAAAPVPAYAFMDRLGLAPPPGGVLDSQNSELLRFLREGPPRDGAGPLVLTFRTAEAPQVVAEFYAREAGVRLRLRETAMGGPFQGVVRTVGRGTARLADGSRATLTVSRPGVDPRSRSLVPETTVRLDVRPAP